MQSLASHGMGVVPAPRGAPVRNRRLRVLTRSHEEFRATLRSLQSLGDEQLPAWAAEHPQELSLSFLSWLAAEEDAASGAGREALWELGGKLMALREGLEPASREALQEELRAAALRPKDGGGAGAAAAAASPSQSTALAQPGFSSLVQQTAALGLSPEGLALFQQQAVALEAVVGTSKAQSLVEVIGRMRVGGREGGSGRDQMRDIMGGSSDAATRILEVLLTLDNREERAAVLPEAFSPPGPSPGDESGEEDGGYETPDEDLLYTTPLQLLQAVDLYLSRLERHGSLEPDGAGVLLLGGGAPGAGLAPGRLEAVLGELREDVLALWEGADSF